MQTKRVAGGVENHPAIDDAQRAVHAQAQTLKHRRQMPGVDRQAVDGSPSPHRLETGPVEEGGAQRVANQGLVEARDSRGGAFERAGDCGDGQGCRPRGQVSLFLGDFSATEAISAA
ncbi:MAG TPA: hypothetical protein VKI44_41020 [Acetobacteraceae bacterium]|nr:hypothetical protein [Acetobacteraceae bacterium]